MNCQKFETVVSELARNQMMEADIRAEALAHTFKCSDCSDRMRDQKLLSSGLSALAADMNHMQAPPQLELKLREAFRQVNQVTPFTVKKYGHTRYWLSAIAAMLLLVIGLAAVKIKVNSIQKQVAEIPRQTMPVSTLGSEGVTPIVRAVAAQNSSNPVEPRRRRHASFYAANTRKRPIRNDEAVVANHAAREVATDFMPLGYMNAASFQDGGQVVRVELPRSVLATFGIPVNMERYNQKVKADVLFGADGLAHAIRFVQ